MTEGLRPKTELTKVRFGGTNIQVSFVESIQINDGVKCDVYSFNGDNTKDLAIIRIGAGYSTPLQKVLDGKRTVEGYLSGIGGFMHKRDGIERFYTNDELEKIRAVEVQIGDEMQWRAGEHSNMVVYEVCYPPFKNGRFEDMNLEF